MPDWAPSNYVKEYTLTRVWQSLTLFFVYIPRPASILSFPIFFFYLNLHPSKLHTPTAPRHFSMAPKRKGENWEFTRLYDLPAVGNNFVKVSLDYPPAVGNNFVKYSLDYPPAKKARLDDAPDASGSSSVDKDASKSKKPTSWRDITLPGEDEARHSPFSLCIDTTDTRTWYLIRGMSPSTTTAARSVAKSDSCRRPRAGK